MMKTNAEKLHDLSVPCSEKEVMASRERISRAPFAKTVAKIVFSIMYYMEKKGISQKKLADMLSVSPAYVNKLLRGKENLTIETISRIENALEESLINVVEPYRKPESIIIKAVHYPDHINFDWSNPISFSTNSTISSLGNAKTA